MVGISCGFVSISAKGDIHDFAGKGCYIGGSVSVGASFGVDSIVFGKNLNEVVHEDETPISGIMASFGLGVGLNWVHEGNTYTHIKVIKKEGNPIPKSEWKWVAE